MASGWAVALAITLSVLSMQGVFVLGRLECEKLPIEFCAFSVSSSGARCVLENYSLAEGSLLYHCKSSAIMAQKTMEWIESDKCLQICGLQRMSVGMSTDDLKKYSDFSYKLCSDKCQTTCPNLGDLYFTLAAKEGLYIPHFCEAHKNWNRRMIFQNGNGDIDNEDPVFPPTSTAINALSPAPTQNAPVPVQNGNGDIDNEDPISAPTPMAINALSPAPTQNAPVPVQNGNGDIDNEDPISAPTPMTINALSPALTQNALSPALTQNALSPALAQNALTPAPIMGEA